MKIITYKINDAYDYPVCYGTTMEKAINEARDWAQTYPHLARLPFKLARIEERNVKTLKIKLIENKKKLNRKQI